MVILCEKLNIKKYFSNDGCGGIKRESHENKVKIVFNEFYSETKFIDFYFKVNVTKGFSCDAITDKHDH